MDPEKHKQYTGRSNERILANLEGLSHLGANLLVRIPVISGVNADELEMRQIGAYLSSLPHPPPVELLAYHNIAEAKYAGLDMPYALPGLHPPTLEQVAVFAKLLQDFGLQVR